MTESTAVLTVTETAQLLRLARNTCYAAVKRGAIPSLRIGRRLLIPRDALERMLRGRPDSETEENDREPL